MKRTLGLFPKYAALLMAFAALLVLASGAVGLLLTYREVREAASVVQRAQTGAAAVQIDQFLGSVRTALVEMARLPWSFGPGSLDRREEYHRLMKIEPAIARLRAIDGAGRDRLSVSRAERDTVDTLQVADASLLARARKTGHAFGRPYFRDGSEPFVTLAAAEPETGWVTLADIDLEFVSDLVKDIRISDRGRVYVVDGDGTLLAHSNLRLVLRRTDLSSYAPLQALRAAISPARATVGMVEGVGLEGAPVLVSGTFIPEGWIVVAEQPRDEVLGPVFAALRNMLLLVVCALVAALILSWLLAQRLSKPILQLRTGAERVARGELDARIDVDTGDEIEALASEFNDMAARLQEYTTGLERKVAERTAELEEAMRARALFLAAASHDLRQPLYAISLLSDALAAERLPAQAADMLGKQRQAIAALGALFDNLLDLSRFESGAVRCSPRDIPIGDILRSLCSEYEVLVRSRGLRWHVEIPDMVIRTDPELFRRLAANLLSNAARYTHEGTVSLEARACGADVVVSVADTGIGIAPEDQERVFAEFVQLDNPARDRSQGVGLGLAIVKRISDLLDARVSIESAVGHGTRISFRAAISQKHGTRAMRRMNDPVAPATFPGLRIWAVEDDSLVRDGLVAQFEAWGVEHAFATDRPGIEHLREQAGSWPDAVILDDMLGPGERGLEIALWLAAHVDRARIVLVTGNVRRERAMALEDSGFLVLRKPLAPQELVRWLESVLSIA